MLIGLVVVSHVLGVHSFVELLGQLLSLSELLLQSLLHLCDVAALHISLASQAVQSLLLSLGQTVGTRLLRLTLVLARSPKRVDSVTISVFRLVLVVLALLVFSQLVLRANLLNSGAQVRDLLDQMNVLVHHLVLGLLVHLDLLLQALHQRVP